MEQAEIVKEAQKVVISALRQGINAEEYEALLTKLSLELFTCVEEGIISFLDMASFTAFSIHHEQFVTKS